MDMSLPAPKLLIAELQAAVQEDVVMSIGALKFQRVWLQGVIVSPLEQRSLLLDDGSAVIELVLRQVQQGDAAWAPGMYVLINGRYCRESEHLVEVHKILDLSAEPNREASWHLEVAEVHSHFYGTLLGCRK